MKKVICTFIGVLLLLSGCGGCLYSCMHPIRHDGPYRGRVVDAETGRPIEGVVVLGTWSKVYTNVAGASHEFYDAQETVTDKNGEFVIRGLGLKLFSNVEPMDVLIFKAGYQYEKGSWASLKGIYYRDKIKWEGEKAIVPLRKITLEERKMKSGPPSPPITAPLEKVKLMLREVDKDMIEQGLPPRETWGGQKIWQ